MYLDLGYILKVFQVGLTSDYVFLNPIGELLKAHLSQKSTSLTEKRLKDKPDSFLSSNVLQLLGFIKEKCYAVVVT